MIRQWKRVWSVIMQRSTVTSVELNGLLGKNFTVLLELIM